LSSGRSSHPEHVPDLLLAPVSSNLCVQEQAHRAPDEIPFGGRQGRTYTWTLLQTKARVRLGGAPTFDQPGGRIVVPSEILRCPALQVSAPLDQAAILEDQLEPLLAAPVELHHRGDRLEDPGEVGLRPIAAPDLPGLSGLVYGTEGYRPGRIAKGLGRGDATCGTQPTCYGSSAVGSALPLRWS